MSHGKILTHHALKTLTQLHGELAGKIESSTRLGDKLRVQMVQVEAVMKMLDPEVNLRGPAIRGSRAALYIGPPLTCCAGLARR